MTLTRFGTHNAVLPKAGPIAYKFQVDFTVKGEFEIDMTPEVSAQHIDFISGCYFDNSKNANPLDIEVASIGQIVHIPAGKQGYMPLLITDAPILTLRTTPNNQLIVPFFVVNFPVWPIIF